MRNYHEVYIIWLVFNFKVAHPRCVYSDPNISEIPQVWLCWAPPVILPGFTQSCKGDVISSRISSWRESQWSREIRQIMRKEIDCWFFSSQELLKKDWCMGGGIVLLGIHSSFYLSRHLCQIFSISLFKNHSKNCYLLSDLYGLLQSWVDICFFVFFAGGLLQWLLSRSHRPWFIIIDDKIGISFVLSSLQAAM